MPLSQRLVRDVLHPLALWHRGETAELRYLCQFERTQFLPIEHVRRLQLARLRTLLDHAYRQCPFYRQRFDSIGMLPSDVQALENLQTLPVLEKSDIQEQRERLVADNWPRRDLIRNQTGGSTGTPIAFYLSRERKCSRAAATVRHNRWAGWDIGDRTAAIWGAPQDVPSRGLWARLRNSLLERQQFLDTGHLTEARMTAFLRSLKRTRPKVILAYARSAVMFARFLQAHRLTPYQPHSIVTSAEVLEPSERRLLEEVFGCPVFNRYGCREVSVVASECEQHDGLHTMAEGLYVEIAHGQQLVAEGELGDILVTDLLNFAMPLIRYRIGDVGAWQPGSCRCGRGLPRLRQVAGRVTDFLVGSDGRLVSGVFLATYLVAQRPSLGQVQMLQEVAGQVRFLIKKGPSFREAADLEYLQSTSRRYLGDDLVLDWEFVDDLPPELSGKFLFCRSRATPSYCASGVTTP
jgi:phenylacetate-CoA ligase